MVGASMSARARRRKAARRTTARHEPSARVRPCVRANNIMQPFSKRNYWKG